MTGRFTAKQKPQAAKKSGKPVSKRNARRARRAAQEGMPGLVPLADAAPRKAVAEPEPEKQVEPQAEKPVAEPEPEKQVELEADNAEPGKAEISEDEDLTESGAWYSGWEHQREVLADAGRSTTLERRQGKHDRNEDRARRRAEAAADDDEALDQGRSRTMSSESYRSDYSSAQGSSEAELHGSAAEKIPGGSNARALMKEAEQRANNRFGYADLQRAHNELHQRAFEADMRGEGPRYDRYTFQPDAKQVEYFASFDPRGEPDKYNAAPRAEDENLALLQDGLRGNSKYNADPDEQLNVNHSARIQRARRSKAEADSEGWALLPMRDEYRANDKGNGMGYHGWKVEYLFDEIAKLEKTRKRDIGGEQNLGRDEHVLELQKGLFQKADGEALDSLDGEWLDQPAREKLNRVEKEMETIGTAPRADELKERLLALQGKRQRIKNGTDEKYSGRYIWVMTAEGRFFAAKGVKGKLHHSSFLGGGAVAAAGDMRVAGGKLERISNFSGHYRPGAVYLWQAVKQLSLSGVDLSAVAVEVAGVKGSFKNARDFLDAMDPVKYPLLFDGKIAIDFLQKQLARSKSKAGSDAQAQTT